MAGTWAWESQRDTRPDLSFLLTDRQSPTESEPAPFDPNAKFDTAYLADDYSPKYQRTPTEEESSGGFFQGLGTGASAGFKGTASNTGWAIQGANDMAGGDPNNLAGSVGNWLSSIGAADKLKVGEFQNIRSFQDFRQYFGELIGQGIGSSAAMIAAGGAGLATAGPVGGIAAAGAVAFEQNYGEMLSTMHENKAVQQALADGKVTRQQLATWATTYGAVMGALDVSGLGEIAKVTGATKALTKDAKKVVAQEIADKLIPRLVKGAAAEGGTEGVQQMVEEIGLARSGGDKSAYDQMMAVANSVVGGAVPGAVFAAPHFGGKPTPPQAQPGQLALPAPLKQLPPPTQPGGVNASPSQPPPQGPSGPAPANQPGGNPPTPPIHPVGATGANTREYPKQAPIPPGDQARVDNQFEILRKRQEDLGISPDLSPDDIDMTDEERTRVNDIFSGIRRNAPDRRQRATSTEVGEYDADLHLAAGAALPKPAAQLEAPLQEGAMAEPQAALPAPPALLSAPQAGPPPEAPEQAPAPFQRTPLPPERPSLPFTPLDRGREAPFGRTSGTIPNPLAPPVQAPPAPVPPGPAPAPSPAPQQVPAAEPERQARTEPSLAQVTAPAEPVFQAIEPQPSPIVERIKSFKGLEPLRRKLTAQQEARPAEAPAAPVRPTTEHEALPPQSPKAPARYKGRYFGTPEKQLHAAVTTAADVKAAAMKAVDWHPDKNVQRQAVERALAEARTKLPQFRKRMPKELVKRGIGVIARRANAIAEEIDAEDRARRAAAGNVQQREAVRIAKEREKEKTGLRKTTADRPVHGDPLRGLEIDRLYKRAKETVERLGADAPLQASAIVKWYDARRPWVKTRSKDPKLYANIMAKELTDKIEALRQSWAKDEDAQMAAYQKALADKQAPEQTAETIAEAEEPEAANEAEAEAIQKRITVKRGDRNAEAKKIAEDHLGPEIFKTFKPKVIGKAMKDALRAAGDRVPSSVKTESYAPWENFLAFAEQQLQGSDGAEFDYHDRVVNVGIAYTILQSGNRKEFNSFIKSMRPPETFGKRQVSEEKQTAPSEDEASAFAPEDLLSGAERLDDPSDYTKERQARVDSRATAEEKADAAAGRERTGPKFHKKDYTYQMRGDEKVWKASDLLDKTKFSGIKGVVDKFFGKIDEAMVSILKHLVGDTKVYILPDDVVSRLGVSDPNQPDPGIGGLYIAPTAYGQSIGQRGYIILPQRMLKSSELRRLLLHEMVHAATLQAYWSDYRGAKQILDNLFFEARKAAFGKGIDPLARGADYGWTHPEEFITEGLSNYHFAKILADLHMLPGDPNAVRLRDIRPGNFFPTVWAGLRAAVARILGMDAYGTKGMTYLDGLMSAFELSAQDPANMRHAAAKFGIDNPAEFHRPRSGIRMEEGIAARMDETPAQTREQAAQDIFGGHENRAFMDSVRDTGQAMWQAGDASGKLTGTRSLRLKFLTNVMGIRRMAENMGWGKTQFADAIDHFLKKEATTNRLRTEGMKIAGKLQRMLMDKATREQVDKAQDIMDEATIANVDMRYDANHPKNAWFSKGDGHLRHRLAHADLRRRYEALKPEVKAMVDELGTTYGKMQRHATVESVKAILHAAQLHTAFQSIKEDVDTVAQWAADGGLQRAGTSFATARDNRIASHLSSRTPDKIRTAVGVRRMQGFFVPLKRRGNKVITAMRNYADAKWLPKGALSIDEDTFQFADSAAYESYIRNNQRTKRDRILNVNHNKKKNTYTVKVQNRYMSMHENQSKAEAERQRLIDGKEWDNVSVVQHARGGIEQNKQLLPQQVQTILAELAKSGMSPAQLKAAEAAIIQSQVGLMQGNRMEHHNRIARQGVFGASTREAVQAMRDYTFGYSNFVSGLQHNPDIESGLQWGENQLKQMQQDDRHMKLSELVREMRRRVEAIDGYSHHPLIHNVTTLTYVSQLMSVVNVFSQMIQTTTTWMDLAGKFGATQTTKEMTKAFRDIGLGTLAKGSFKNVGTAGMDVLRAIIGRTPLLNIDHAETIKSRLKGFDLRAFQAMEDIGLIDANAGQEMEVSRLGQGYFSNLIGAVGSVVQAMTAGIEAMNRSVSMLASARLHLKNGMSEEDAIRAALNVTEETQGLYSSANAPPAFNTTGGRVAFQFKKFALFTGNWLAKMIFGGFGGMKALATGNKMTDQQRTMLKTMGWTLLVMGALSGGQGAVPWEVVGLPLMIIQALLGYKKPTNVTDSVQQGIGMVMNYLGATTETARKTAEVAMHGLPRLLGAELSDRIGYSSLATFGQPKSFSSADMWSFVGKTLGGPFAAKGLDTVDWMGKHDATYTSMPFLPKFIKDIDKAYTGADEGSFTKGGRQKSEPLSPWETAQKAAGFSTAREKRIYEPGGVERLRIDETEIKADRSAIMSRWYKADLLHDDDGREDAMAEVREWNAEHDRTYRIDRGDLYKLRQSRRTAARKDRRKYGEEAYQ